MNVFPLFFNLGLYKTQLHQAYSPYHEVAVQLLGYIPAEHLRYDRLRTSCSTARDRVRTSCSTARLSKASESAPWKVSGNAIYDGSLVPLLVGKSGESGGILVFTPTGWKLEFVNPAVYPASWIS